MQVWTPYTPRPVTAPQQDTGSSQMTPLMLYFRTGASSINPILPRTHRDQTLQAFNISGGGGVGGKLDPHTPMGIKKRVAGSTQ